LKWTTEEAKKQNYTTNAMTSFFLFLQLTSLSSIAIVQHHQRMEFTSHNSYAILELVNSTVNFCTEVSCRRKSCSDKNTLLLDWSHRYTNYMVVITIWLTVTKYPYLER